MKVKIFKVSHAYDEKREYMSNDIYSDFIIGEKSRKDCFLGDMDNEDNISSDETQSEMRAHYYIWKNHTQDYDYIGFEHYRRILNIDFLHANELKKNYPAILYLRKKIEKDQLSEIFFDSPAFREIIKLRKNHDAYYENILKKKISEYDIFCVRSQNISTKSAICDDALLEHVFSSISYFSKNPMLVDFNHTTTNYRCSFLMKKLYFNEYMEFWFEVISILKKILEGRPRELGYYSEKIFSYYLFQKKMENPLIKVNYVPMISP